MISIIWKSTDESITEEFDRINKSISVPRVYMEKNLSTVKDIFLDFARLLERKYPKLVSSSRNCQRPHFNRDVLIDNLVSIHQSKRFKHLGALELVCAIKLMNKCYIAQRYGFDFKDLSNRIQEKCSEYNLWLFCEDRTIDRDYLRKVIKNNK